jgi:hypothetical protein
MQSSADIQSTINAVVAAASIESNIFGSEEQQVMGRYDHHHHHPHAIMKNERNAQQKSTASSLLDQNFERKNVKDISIMNVSSII